MSADSRYQYDVCFSFAGEQRTYVEKVAELLRASGFTVFYDRFERVSLWGKDLYEHLTDIYRERARFCVIFVSSDYASKHWTTHERKSAQARAVRENQEYILPARFDDTVLPGLNPTVGYIDLRETEPVELARLLAEKISGRADDVVHIRTNQQVVPSTPLSAHETIRTSAPPQAASADVRGSGTVPKMDGCSKVAAHVLLAFGGGAAFAIFMFLFSGPRRWGQQMLYNASHFNDEWTPSFHGFLAWLLITATVIAVDVFLATHGFDTAAYALTFFGMVSAFTAWNLITYIYFPDSPIGQIVWPLAVKTLGASLTTSVAVIILIRRRAARRRHSVGPAG